MVFERSINVNVVIGQGHQRCGSHFNFQHTKKIYKGAMTMRPLPHESKTLLISSRSWSWPRSGHWDMLLSGSNQMEVNLSRVESKYHCCDHSRSSGHKVTSDDNTTMDYKVNRIIGAMTMMGPLPNFSHPCSLQ